MAGAKRFTLAFRSCHLCILPSKDTPEKLLILLLTGIYHNSLYSVKINNLPIIPALLQGQ